MSWELETVAEITPEVISAIFHKEIAGLRIPSYCHSEVALRAAELLLQRSDRTNYQVRWYRLSGDEPAVHPDKFEVTDTDRVGGVDTTPDVDEPFPSLTRELRRELYPQLGPIDRLRLDLDDVLPLGARPYRRPDGTRSSVGVGRIMTSAEQLVHADTGRKGCLTANIYLQLPRQNRGVRIWNHTGYFLEAPGSYLFGEDEIPEETPSCLLIPTEGELVIWNPTCPHVVYPFSEGMRVSMQTWLKVVADDEEEDRIGVEMLN